MANDAYHYDVLVVGSGSAACSAALAAVDQGARVGILEKAPKRDRGGNSALTVQMRFVFNGIEDLRPLVKNMAEGTVSCNGTFRSWRLLARSFITRPRQVSLS